MAVSGWGLISLYIYIRHFKNLFVRNHWTYFNIMAKLFLWWPSFNIQFKPSWCMKKTWPLGCRAIKFIQKSLSSELGWNFNSKYAKLFAQVSHIGPSWSSCLFCIFTDKNNRVGLQTGSVGLVETQLFFFICLMSGNHMILFRNKTLEKCLGYILYHMVLPEISLCIGLVGALY